MMPEKKPPTNETGQFNYDSRELIAKLDRIISLLESRAHLTPRYCSPKQVAAICGTSADVIRRMIRRGQIQASKIGSSIYIDKQAEKNKEVFRRGA